MRVRSFFSVKNGEQNGKICLQGYFKPVFESNPSQRCTRIFQSVCQKNSCSLSLSSSIFAGSNPAVRCKTYRQWIGFVLRDAKRTVHEIVCENVFILTFVIIRQSEKHFGASRRAMQKQALPENGYRVIPNSAKRFLSALCRKHSNFQPLLLHE